MNSYELKGNLHKNVFMVPAKHYSTLFLGQFLNRTMYTCRQQKKNWSSSKSYLPLCSIGVSVVANTKIQHQVTERYCFWAMLLSAIFREWVYRCSSLWHVTVITGSLKGSLAFSLNLRVTVQSSESNDWTRKYSPPVERLYIEA